MWTKQEVIMLKPARIFQSDMMLQCGKPVMVWGTADPCEIINVSVQNQSATCMADEEGCWTAELPELHPSEMEVLIITGSDETITYENVAVGEVWIAGGQSNMEFHMRYEKHLAEVKPSCSNRNIRFYDVPEIAFDGQDEIFDYGKVGIWRYASPEDIEYFSAAGYYFQRKLEKDLAVPVGIVGCNWGGTVAASWMNPETVRKAGPVWLDEYEHFVSDINLDVYWAEQRANPMNDRGNVFSDPFSEFIMPRTPSPEEVGAFFAKLAESGFMPDLADGMGMLPSNFPGRLYETMVKKIASFTVRGVLWYQGESDDEQHHSDIYDKMLEGLISDWRRLWEDEQLSFLIVQLPGFERWLAVECDRFDLIRTAQARAAETLDNVWLCSISDGGEQFDIHPKDKLIVGERLALLARGHVYGEDILCDAPALRSAERDGNNIVLTFDNAEGGLVLEGDEINALVIHSGDSNLPFRYYLNGDTIIIQADGELPQDMKLDFAQGSYYKVNLYNMSHIPAIPFSVEI